MISSLQQRSPELLQKYRCDARHMAPMELSTHAMAQFSTGYIHSLAAYGLVSQEGKPPRYKPKNLTFQADSSCIRRAPRSLLVQCYSTVSLADIRKISVSCGAPGKTRNENHISGLRFEFFSSTNPIFVGQWYNEIDSLDLEPGDRITGLTFWQTQETPSDAAARRRENTGRVAGIRIIKSGSEPKQLEVCLLQKGDLLKFSFYESLFEDLVRAFFPHEP